MTDQEFNVYKEVINRYKKQYPQEWNVWLKGHKQRKADLHDEEYGTSTGEQNMRATGSMPDRLDARLRLAQKQLLHKEEEYFTPKFLNKFPVFKLANKN